MSISTEPRKILHLTRVAEGGAMVVVDQLARGLNKKRFEPVVGFATDKNSNIRHSLTKSKIKTINLTKFSDELDTHHSQPIKNRNIGSRIEIHFGQKYSNAYFSLKSFYQFLFRDIPKIKLLSRIIKENRIDLVHTHDGLKFGKPEIIAAWITGVPCVSHNHAFYQLIFFDKIFIKFVDLFIYISSEMDKYFTAQGKPHQKGFIIHNGVNISKYKRSYDQESVRDEFNIRPGEFCVGIIGRLDWWKGHEYFLDAMARVSKHIPALKGLIIGGEETKGSACKNRQYFRDLHSLVYTLGLSDKIIFTGFRGDVPRMIAAMDVVVHASSAPEPFGLVIIEGMAAGKPVIATKAGGVFDIIEDGVNGLLVPCKDSQAMAQAILKIIRNRDLAKRMGLAGRKRVVDRFTTERQVKAVEELYDYILRT